MYSRGEGVPEDLVFAYLWYDLSAAQGNETAQSKKNVIEQRMTREQIAEAQRLSREWIETHPQDGGDLAPVIAKLARERAGELVKLAEELGSA